MPITVDKRREDINTIEEYVSVINLFSIFFKILFKKHLLSKILIYDLKRFWTAGIK